VRLMTVSISACGAAIYAGALAAVSSENTQKVGIVVIVHLFYQSVYEIFEFVVDVFLESPRAASPAFERDCQQKCRAALANNTDDSVCRRNGGSNDDLCKVRLCMRVHSTCMWRVAVPCALPTNG
jgi:hypothetical protein